MTTPRTHLAGQVVVVTGAARGLGQGMAEQIAARGGSVALLGLEPELLEQVSSRIGGTAKAWSVDVTDQAALDAVAAQVIEHFGRVDIVVANAGIATGGPTLVADPVSFDRTVEVNLFGSIRTARAFLPALVDSRGYLLQVASMAAMLPIPGMAAYCTSKTGVETFAHCLRGEVIHHGVDVGVAYLNWTDTEMVRGADATPGLGTMRAQLKGPLGRTVPLPDAVELLVAGLEKRAAHVYVPTYMKYVQPLRWLLPAATAYDGRKRGAQAEQMVRDHGTAITRPVGAGGRADEDARGLGG